MAQSVNKIGNRMNGFFGIGQVATLYRLWGHIYDNEKYRYIIYLDGWRYVGFKQQ